MIPPQGTVMESQLDWITCAAHTTGNVDAMSAYVTRLARAEGELGNKARPFRSNGYVGEWIGRVRYGWRSDFFLSAVSGDLAERHFSDLYGMSDSVTRLDLAVTVQLDIPDDAVAKQHWEEANAYRAEHPRVSRPHLHQDGDGGATLYLGERVSDWYLRVYNKERECQNANDSDGVRRYQRCWRYELECKAGASTSMALAADSTANRADWCKNYLYQYAVTHGLAPRFTPDGPCVLRPGFRRRSDATTKLGWLTKSVRPTLIWLNAKGYGGDVRKALGLDDGPQSDGTPLPLTQL